MIYDCAHNLNALPNLHNVAGHSYQRNGRTVSQGLLLGTHVALLKS